MFYNNRIVIQQNPNFYNKETEGGVKFVELYDPTDVEARNWKRDTTEYTLEGHLGKVLSSTSFFKIPVGTVRRICGFNFILNKQTKNNFSLTRWSNSWTCDGLDTYHKINIFKEKVLHV